jgi:hypothetical protein
MISVHGHALATARALLPCHQRDHMLRVTAHPLAKVGAKGLALSSCITSVAEHVLMKPFRNSLMQLISEVVHG